MKKVPTTDEINSLFANGDPDLVWAEATAIVSRISAGYDYTLVKAVFDDVLRLFRGEYPGYTSIKTLYHDLPHTLDVFMCAVRLLHGVHLSGVQQNDECITRVMIATLMHDVGYAQQLHEANGTGAQFTQIHVRRGIAFMRNYFAADNLAPALPDTLEPIMLSTDPVLTFSEINFPDARTRLLAQIVGTADLLGQMADRSYLEKLLFLYLEFKEAHFGNYLSTHDLLRQTKVFYGAAKEKLDNTYNGIYACLALHFNDTMGVQSNYYLESIEKNIAYLTKVLELSEPEQLAMLKRSCIVAQSKAIPAAD